MKIHDTKTGELVEFEPINDGKVGMYVCGPTVYDFGHLGHGRSAVCFDVIRRYFIYKGYDVKFVSNYTDIDDKMINRAKEKGISVEQLANEIIPEYVRDYTALGVMPSDISPKATDKDNIAEMIDIIERLEKKGHIYVLDDGVYFDVKTYKEYCEFSGQKLEDLKVGARVDVKEGKRNPYDFVLWKFKKEGEPAWPSRWGEGRPGWHIECSAMSFLHLGEKFDIHGGGLDLVFPHHECEVAQSLCAFGPDSFAKYWMHNGFINIDNEKMSKSLGNFFTLRNVFERYDPKIVRFMFLQTHYRNPINFSFDLLEQSKAGLERLRNFARNLKVGYESLSKDVYEVGAVKLTVDAKHMQKGFEEFMDNDFDLSGALGVVFDLVKSVNGLRDAKKLTQEDVDEAEKFLKNVDEVLDVIFEEEEDLDGDVKALIEKREEARKSKDFAMSDKIRDELKAKGIELEDTAGGTIWKRV
ncbi:cysteine--tRNA ligase [Candidatus Peregrinibacteria bacterium CG_4_10_14_0_2_um_filter_38_24]|nr:MAG: cysteine--tRNA ligase [Candidatus Peregrinibacteria bacterium CG_4_10_14_0_2_um_filter_38_24]PJC38545.1 MAG: cysteine--tRNA ligase [Candidatus Peregrinibacteria bacterium CG_4_9_14_0_2_um_filter_38_9]